MDIAHPSVPSGQQNSKFKGDKATADEDDALRQMLQFHELAAGLGWQGTVDGQRHGDCTGGQDDKSGVDSPALHVDRMLIGNADVSDGEVDISVL